MRARRVPPMSTSQRRHLTFEHAFYLWAAASFTTIMTVVLVAAANGK